MIDLTSKMEEINNIKSNKGSKIYPLNQVILNCIVPNILLKKSKKNNIFFLLFLIGKNRHGIGKNVAILIGNGDEIRPLEMGRKSPVYPANDFRLPIFWS